MIRSLAKILLKSRPVTVGKSAPEGEKILVLGNGPSLADELRGNMDYLSARPCMAVNFAANAPQFSQLKPRYYILMDPHFFETPSTDPNVGRLWENLGAVDWPMTLLVPRRYAAMASGKCRGKVTLETFNDIGLEGPGGFRRWCYRHRLGMPRPRNVLIPAIMCAMWLGYREIEVFGADHSWMRTLSVADDNTVVSVQPHFYADNTSEKERVTAVYRDIPLHRVVESFAIAFRSYHLVADYARHASCRVLNRTRGSMIDAFPRG